MKENALKKLVEYRAAHLVVKNAPEGKKSQAIRQREKAHSDLLLAAELYEKHVMPDR